MSYVTISKRHYEKLVHYAILEEQLEELFGGKLPLDKVVETLKRIVQNGEEKLDYARILTNAEAEKWDRWKSLEEQGRLIDWRKTSEEKPDSTRHLIVSDGEYISHYGYYLKPKDKWFTDWMCEKEIDAPMFWMDMPDPPKESLHGDCGAKMDEAENE